MQLTLETERLILRDFQLGDIEAWLTITSHPKYQTFYPKEECSPEFNAHLLEMFVEQSEQRPRTKFQLVIEGKESHQVIGTVGFRLEADNQASIGFGLAVDRQGRGIAVEAMSALIEFGIGQFAPTTIFAETKAGNKAAIAVCRRLGLKQSLTEANPIEDMDVLRLELVVTVD
ncbi:GNAT family N-acetyltransferase [Vibrio mediterranei]|jgi:RimJ/RimL family protein N-acetyltransferase|uniref:GNAT family N-acetyltransferase n=1 Tax=Vibrio barjaei TaxID=1676683 RepID=A0ABW7IG42_9VIBR|nr:GNAT family N-acetyltransferase [Vibrio mediterranei]